MSIKLVVFDMAGTTVRDDNKVTETFRAALQKFGYLVPDGAINPLMGYKKSIAITKMLHQYEPVVAKISPELIDDIHQEFIQLMIAYYQRTHTLEALPNVESTMRLLRSAGIKVGINTGFSRDIAEIIVQRLRWQEKELFDFLIGSDEVDEGRPSAEMINRLMKFSAITNPLEVAKVGDTEVDVREGQNAGCKYVIAVTTGAFSREELEPYQPTHIIDDISDILDIID